MGVKNDALRTSLPPGTFDLKCWLSEQLWICQSPPRVQIDLHRKTPPSFSVPPSKMPPPAYSNRKHPRDEDSTNDDKSKKRKSSDGTTTTTATTKQSATKDVADAKARIQEMLKKNNLSSTVADKIAAAKARVAAKSAVMEQNVQALAKAEEDARQAKGGLAVNVHPSLLADLPSMDRRNRGHVGPKFSTTLANLNRQSEVVARQMQKGENAKEKEQQKKLEILTKPAETDFSRENNPYYDPKLDVAYSVQKDRKSRPLVFVPHGKFIDKAKQARAAAKMAELKRAIEERARKAGLEEDLDVGDREVLLRPEPPEIEWWDEDFVVNKTYDDLDDEAALKLDGEETKITLYIQHPIPIPPPVSGAPPRPVMMTAKEMAKARRIRRAEEQKDTRGKILLGLIPPDPPKIKLSNLMKVLTSEAVKDPTAVERRVRKEVDARKNKHEQTNEARKLTKEERHSKLSEKRAVDVLRTGLHCCLFRIANLSNPSHRFKIDQNARQLELTGIVIMNPRTNIVIVEGGLPAIKKYKRLMMARIDWTENARNPVIAKGNQEILEEPEPEDLSANTCDLVWEGELRTRNFKIWVGQREASNDAAARNWLGKGAENFWRLAVRSEHS